MKVLFLNCWYAKAEDKFFNYIKDTSQTVDVFCLQEIHPELFKSLENDLPNHIGSYTTENLVEVLGYVYGQAIFIRKGMTLDSLEKVDLFQNVKDDAGFLQYGQITHPMTFHLGNIHGMARPGAKLDTETRIKQSKIIVDFFKNKKGPKIFGGDFNLMPNTSSIGMFEEAGYRDLIKEFDIKDTRNRLAWEQFPNEENQHFADYVFVSPDLKVNSFEVPNIEISDHLPLILGFDV